MGDAGDAWFEALQKRGERQRRIVDNAKIADSIVRTNPEILQSLGMNADTFAAQSAEDKANAVQGVFAGQGYKKAVLDMQKMGVDVNAARQRLNEDLEAAPYRQKLLEGDVEAMPFRQQLLKGEAEAFRRRQAGLQSFGEAAKAYSGIPQYIRRPDRSAYLEDAMLGSGMDPRDVFDISRSLKAIGSQDFTPGAAVEIPGTGYFRQQVSPQGWQVFPGPGARKTTAKTQAPNEPWVIGDNEQEFDKNLLRLDPETAAAAVAARTKHRQAMGKISPREEMMMWVMTGKSAEDYFKWKATQTGKGPPGPGAAVGAGGPSFDDFQMWKKNRK